MGQQGLLMKHNTSATPVEDLVVQLSRTDNPVTKSVLQEIIEKRVLRGEIGRFE